MASPSKEKSATVTERADAMAQHWHHHLQRLEEWGAGQQYPTQQLCALSTAGCEPQNPVHGRGKSYFTPTGVEDSPGDFWTAGGGNVWLGCRGPRLLPATLPPDHRQPQRHHGFVSCMAFSPRCQNQHPLHQPHRQSQNGMPIFPMAAERVFGQMTPMGGRSHRSSGTIADSPCHQPGLHHQQREGGDNLAMNTSCNYVEKTTGKDSGSGLRQGGRGRRGRVADGQIGGGSPKSSASSEESAEGLVGNSPTAVWDVGMRGEGGGGGGSSGSVGRKMPLTAADANAVALIQPRTSTTQDAMSIDELKQLLLCTGMELQSARTGAGEEGRNREENLKQLLQFIKIALLERDEAKEQLQKLHAEMAAQPRPNDHNPSPPHLQHGLASSLELPTPNKTHCGDTAPGQRPTLHEGGGFTPPMSSSETAKFDLASAVIDRLAANKALPEKGKLLQAVLDAGPLLQTLLVAGALPRWRNPPPLQPVQVPPLSATRDQNAFLNRSVLVRMSPSMFHRQNPGVASQISTAYPLASPSLRALCMSGPLMPAGASSYQDTAGERKGFN